MPLTSTGAIIAMPRTGLDGNTWITWLAWVNATKLQIECNCRALMGKTAAQVIQAARDKGADELIDVVRAYLK